MLFSLLIVSVIIINITYYTIHAFLNIEKLLHKYNISLIPHRRLFLIIFKKVFIVI